MGICDDKGEVVEAEAQLQTFNLAQLQCVVITLEQRQQGFGASSITDPQENHQRGHTEIHTNSITRQQTPVPSYT